VCEREPSSGREGGNAGQVPSEVVEADRKLLEGSQVSDRLWECLELVVREIQRLRRGRRMVLLITLSGVINNERVNNVNAEGIS